MPVDEDYAESLGYRHYTCCKCGYSWHDDCLPNGCPSCGYGTREEEEED